MSATPARTSSAPTPPADPLRRLLLALLLLGIVGTLAELFLLEHYEESWQLTPIVLLSAALPLVALCWVRPSRAALRALQTVMVLFVVGGMMGIWRHYSGNTEFELEMYPSRAGFELLWESLRGATPVLAPGSLSLLGLLGLIWAFRHPIARR